MSKRPRSELRPTFFMSRGNGVFTPLIPADELPMDMMIVGIPRVMSFGETTGMTSVGEIMASGLCYEIKVGTDIDRQCEAELPLIAQSSRASNAVLAKQPPFAVTTRPTTPPSVSPSPSVSNSPVRSARPSTSLSTSGTENTTQASPNASPKCEYQRSGEPDQSSMTSVDNSPSLSGVCSGKGSPELASMNTGLDMTGRSSLGTQAVIDAIVSTTRTTGSAFPSSRAPQRQRGQGPIRGPLKDDFKTYCSYWVRHGECDYTQQGCRFLHEMPQDRETLIKIGLRDFPRWWKELNALNVGTWRHRSPSCGVTVSSTGPSQQSYANRTSSNTGVTVADNSESTVVGRSQFDEKVAVGSTSDPSGQTKEAVTTAPLRSLAIRQRQPRTRDGSSTSSATSSNSAASTPEASQVSRFVPGALHPQTRALRIQRLMSPGSSPKGEVWVQKDSTEGQGKAEDCNAGNADKGNESSLIELEGLNVA